MKAGSRYQKKAHRILELADKILVLADDIFSECEEEDCILRCNLIRDSAYTIRVNAEKEKKRHTVC